MVELFSDIFTYRENALTRVDIRAKLIVTLAALLAVILSTRFLLPVGMLAIAVTVMLALRIPPRLLFFRLLGPMGIALVVAVLRAVTTGSTPLFGLALAGHHLLVTREGLFGGLLIACRVLGAVSVLLLCGFVAPAHAILRALGQWRFCRAWVEVAAFMYRYIFVLVERVADLGAAQRLRLGYVGVRRSLSSAGALAGAVLIHSLEQAHRTHEAMLVRGYTGSLPIVPLPAVRRRDLALALAAVLGLAVAYMACEWRRVR